MKLNPLFRKQKINQVGVCFFILYCINNNSALKCKQNMIIYDKITQKSNMINM